MTNALFWSLAVAISYLFGAQQVSLPRAAEPAPAPVRDRGAEVDVLAGAVADLQAVAAPRPESVRSACPPAPSAPRCAVAPACTVALALDLPRWWRGDVGLFLSGAVVALVASQLGRRDPNRSAGVVRLRSYGG